MTKAAAAARQDEHADDPRDLDAPGDDRVDGPIERAEKRDDAEVDEPEAREPLTREGPYEARRKAVAEKFRKMRSGGQDDIDVYGGEDREKEIFGDRIETRSDRLRKDAEADEEHGGGAEAESGAARSENAASETAAERRRRKLKVNGREVEIDEDDVIAHAQRSLAAGNILEEAKRLRSQYYEKLEAVAGGGANQPANGAASERQTTDASEDTKPDDTELDDIIDKIQVGDTHEARAALNKYGASLEERILQRIGNLDEHIERHTSALEARRKTESDTRTTLDQFVSDHSEFADNPVLQSALQSQLISVMRESMAELGVDERGLQKFQQNFGIADPNAAIGAAYRYLQRQNYPLPDHGTALKTSAERVRTAFRSAYDRTTERGVDERRTDPLAARREAKRSLAPQPRRAGASAVEQPDLSRDEQRRRAVADARAARRGH